MRVAVLVLLLGVTGCDFTRAKVYDHVVATGLPAQPRTILVIEAMDIGFAPDLPTRFGDALHEDLARCGSDSLVQRADPLSLLDPARLRAEVVAFRPDAELVVRESSSSATAAGARDDVYAVRLTGLPGRRDLWSGVVRLETASPVLVSRNAAGPVLAARIVAQLAHDRVLTACPAPATQG